MAKDFSFDIECKFDMQELKNALDQAKREILTRYDFKGATADIELSDEKLTINADDAFRMDAIKVILTAKLLKRNQSPNILDWSKTAEPASGMTIRQEIPFVKALDKEQTRAIRDLIKAGDFKVKSAIQGDSIRVTSGSKDDLQKVMDMLRADKTLDAPLTFGNFR